MSGLLIGNLDCELRWAGHERLPADVTAMVSAAAVTMRALAEPGDRLWTLAPLDPARVPAIDGLPAITFASGALPPAERNLPWGQTAEVATLPRAAIGDGWWQALWSLHCDPAIAAACNRRELSFELGRELGVALPGARLLSSIDELLAHLAAGGARAGHQGAWTLAAPLSASGRLRLRRRGTELDGAARARAERLFRRYQTLLFQPWLDRTGDLGQTGIVSDEGVHLLPPHRQECDRAGVFRAAIIDDRVPPAGAAELQRAAERAGSELFARGYRGAFGIDAFTYRDPSGALALQPLSEINARLSFGLLARVLSERLGLHPISLRLGRGAVPGGSGIVPLVLPGTADPTCVWIESRPSGSA